MLCRLAGLPAPTIVQVVLAGLTVKGLKVMAQQVPRRTRSGLVPQQSAWWRQHRQLAVQCTKNSCVGHLLVAVPRYYLTHQSRSPVFLLFLHFLFKFYPVAIIGSHNNFAWYPRPFSYIYRYRTKRLVEWREFLTLSEPKHRIILFSQK